MNDLEKLITDLSNYWDLSPEKVVDRLNHMNESEIKNVVNKMTKKFQQGGFIRSIGANTHKPINVTGYKFYNDTLKVKPGHKDIHQLFVQEGYTDDGVYDVADVDKGRTIHVRPEGNDTVYFDRPRTFIQGFPVDMARNQEQAKEHWYKWLEWADPKDKEVQKVRKEEWVYKDGGIIKCLKGGKTYTECKKCGGKAPIVKNQEPADKMTAQLPKYGKIVEQGWDKPRYTFMSDVNDGDLSTVTPNNLPTYDGMAFAVEKVANPWGPWVNQMNKTADLPMQERMYREPDFRLIVQQDDLGERVPIAEPMDFVYPRWNQKRAVSELKEKQQKIRTPKKK